MNFDAFEQSEQDQLKLATRIGISQGKVTDDKKTGDNY